MFVRQSTYEAVCTKLVEVDASNTYHRNMAKELQDKWNALIKRINAKGGEQFLEHGVIKPSAQFTEEELSKLIRLCHPDKHNNSLTSNEMTVRLLAMKKGN